MIVRYFAIPASRPSSLGYESGAGPGTWSASRPDVTTYSDGGHYCHRCRMEFDGHPDEGGDFDDRDPSRRLQRKEARRASR